MLRGQFIPSPYLTAYLPPDFHQTQTGIFLFSTRHRGYLLPKAQGHKLRMHHPEHVEGPALRATAIKSLSENNQSSIIN